MAEQQPVELAQGYAKIDEAPSFDPAWYKLDRNRAGGAARGGERAVHHRRADDDVVRPS